MGSVAQVQVLNNSISIFYRINDLEETMDPSLLLPTMDE